jgi:hypothetical protein
VSAGLHVLITGRAIHSIFCLRNLLWQLVAGQYARHE